MDNVGRDQWLLAILNDALHRPFCGSAERLIHFFNRYVTPDLSHEIRDRTGRWGYAKRHAVELALKVWKDQTDRLGGAGRCGDDRQCSGPRAAKILVRSVDQLLIGRVRVDRGHEAPFDSKGVVKNLDHRGEAVRRAARIGNDFLLAG